MLRLSFCVEFWDIWSFSICNRSGLYQVTTFISKGLCRMNLCQTEMDTPQQNLRAVRYFFFACCVLVLSRFFFFRSRILWINFWNFFYSRALSFRNPRSSINMNMSITVNINYQNRNSGEQQQKMKKQNKQWKENSILKSENRK